MHEHGGAENRPRASVLMPAYNNARYLDDAVRSILAQTLSDFEFIIIDDGSTDGSQDLLEEYARRDSRVRLLRNDSNRGIVYSLNRGLDACRGRYVVRMDSDDWAFPDRLERQLAVMDSRPDVIALCGAVIYMDAEGRDTGVVRLSDAGGSLLRRNGMIHPTAVFRREVLSRQGIRYRETYRYAEDYFLWLQLSRLGSIVAIDEPVLRYRLSDTASRVRHLKQMLLATLRVKVAGVRQLRIRPTAADLVRFCAECILLLLPSRLVLRMFLWQTFSRRTGVSP